MSKVLKIEAVFFDLDDTLYNSTLMSQSARKNAVRAMIEAGLDIDEDTAFNLLMSIVKKYGSNYNKHFDRLLEELSVPSNPKLIAAAIVAYHRTKFAHLRPFPDVVLTLLTLRKNHKIGIITDGKKVKQWEKLIYLGLEHFFDLVIINDKKTRHKPNNFAFKKAMKKLNFKKPEKIIYVGNKIDTDILGAKNAKWISILFDFKKMVKKEALAENQRPDYIINRISEVIKILDLEQTKLADI